MYKRGVGRHHRLGLPPGQVSNADLDYDFADGTYWQRGLGAQPVASLITCSRASTGYAADTSGTWSSFASNVARLTNQGLLAEESRTNSIRNNSMQGAASAGSPPTNWSANLTNTNGITTTWTATGTESGIDWAELNISGTASAGFNITVQFDSKTQIAGSSGQTWASSFFIYLSAGTSTGINSVKSGIFGYNDSAVQQESNLSSAFTIPTSGPLGSARQSHTFALANASTTKTVNGVLFNIANGATVNATYRIGWPQYELGTWVTSPIRSTNAAVTRAADVLTVAIPPVIGGVYTMSAAGTPLAPTSYATGQVIFSLSDGTANNRVAFLRQASTGNVLFINVRAGSSTTLSSSTVWSGSGKSIASVDGDALLRSDAFNGVLLNTDGAAPVIPSYGEIHLGDRGDGTVQWNGYISRVAVWASTRLANAILQAITT